MDVSSLLSQSMVDKLRLYVFAVFQLFVAVVVGLLLGWFVSKVVERFLKIPELQKTLIRYGAVTAHLWDSVVSFLSHYLMWLTLVLVVNMVFTENPLLWYLSSFLIGLFGFIVFTLIGVMLGGIIYKISKQTLIAVGLEAELEKHKVADKLGGIPLTSILAGILKWYVVIVFVKQGIELLGLPTLVEAMNGLYMYIPQAILGILILLATLILADLASSNVKKKGHGFSDVVGMGVEVVILFFGVIIALPRLLGVPDPESLVFMQSMSVMTDSFKFLMLGVAAGIAFAVGLGMKEYIAKASKKL